jgi:hypothetical protein
LLISLHSLADPRTLDVRYAVTSHLYWNFTANARRDRDGLKIRMKKVRASYQKRVYDRKFQQQKYDCRKRDHKKNAMQVYMKKNFPEFVHIEKKETSHVDRMRSRKIEYFKEIGATLLCVEFDEP